jgi:hypothetical protein
LCLTPQAGEFLLQQDVVLGVLAQVVSSSGINRARPPELPGTPTFFATCRLSWMRADAQVPPTVAESLPHEQSLEAQHPGAISQNGVKGELIRFCVLDLHAGTSLE